MNYIRDHTQNCFEVFRSLRTFTWPDQRRLLVLALTHRLVAVVIFGPLMGWFLHLIVASSGEQALTDQEIARFLFSPFGAIAAITYVVAVISITALEQTSLLTTLRVRRTGHRPTIRITLAYSLSHFWSIARASFRVVATLLAMALPFLAAGGLAAWWLLRPHDINFYLDTRPPEFWWAGAVIGLILAASCFVILPRLAGYLLTLPILLFERTEPKEAVAESQRLSRKSRVLSASCLLLCLLTFAVAYWIYSLVLWQLGRFIIPSFRQSIAALVPAVGILFFLWVAGTLAISVLQSSVLAQLTLLLYRRVRPSRSATAISGQRNAATPSTTTPPPTETPPSRRRHLIALVSGAVVATTVVAYGTGIWLIRHLDDERSTTLVIAHRGASAKAPENSLAAFEQAIEDGTDMVELDVQETADGKVVVFHDSDFMKVAGTELKIWDATSTRLQNIDIGSHFHTDFADQRVPTLREALQLCRDRTIVNIELKYYGHDQQLARRVVELVSELEMDDQVVYMSLKQKATKELKKLRPNATVGLLSAVSIGDLTGLEADFFAVSTKLADRRLIRRVHATGKSVYVWTVDDPAAMLQLIAAGADGLITNAPSVARDVVQEWRQMSRAERFLVHVIGRAGFLPPATSRPNSE